MLAAHAAKDVTQALREISKFLTEEKARINNSISNDIAALNASLESVAQLNDEIVKVNLRRGDPSTFLDQRQRIVDSIAKIIPIKEIQRDFGRITLAASDGRLLLDRTMTYLDARASTVSLSLDEATGFKNVIYINGEALARDSKLLEGSKLGSLQHISEVEIPRVQKIIDNVANTLIKQFSQRNVDPTLREGEDGLFTASESHINSPSSVGLAGRIALSPYLDPNRPEDLWRLRDGLNAEAPGPKGSSLILSKMIEALNSSSSLSEPGGLNQDIYSHVSDIGAEISTNRMQSDLLGARLMARAEVLRQSVATFGVDSDAELQKLLLLEKHFSANAKIISSIDEMLRTIIAI
jgi:flagellar hook-associated protein 1 FlgK